MAQGAFGRAIQKMLRSSVLSAREPLQGVRPHTQVRRVYERERENKSESKQLFVVDGCAFNALLDPSSPWFKLVIPALNGVSRRHNRLPRACLESLLLRAGEVGP